MAVRDFWPISSAAAGLTPGLLREAAKTGRGPAPHMRKRILAIEVLLTPPPIISRYTQFLSVAGQIVLYKCRDDYLPSIHLYDIFLRILL